MIQPPVLTDQQRHRQKKLSSYTLLAQSFCLDYLILLLNQVTKVQPQIVHQKGLQKVLIASLSGPHFCQNHVFFLRLIF